MIATFTRFDLMTWFPRKQTLLTLLFVVVVGMILPVPGMAVVAASAVSSLMVSTPFLGDERGRLDILYGVLPLARRSVVIGRVLSLVVYYLVAAALATAVTVAMAMARGDQFAPEILLIAHAAAFAFVGLSAALQLPVFFRIGYSRGRLMSYAPVLVLAGLGWLAQSAGMLEPLSDAAAGIPLGIVVGGGFLLGAIGITVGTATSVRLYRSREL